MHCHRCKAPILPGETIVRYNKPAPGTPYHRTCPNGAVPESQASAPKATPAAPVAPAPVQHAGPLSPDALAAIVAAVTTALVASRPAPLVAQPAPVEPRGWEGLDAPAPIISEPMAPRATTPDEADEADEDEGTCLCCGLEECPNCPAHEVLVSKGYEVMGFDCPAREWHPERTFADAQSHLLAALDVYNDRNGTSPLITGGHQEAWNDLFADAAEGLKPRDLKRLLDWHQGVAEGVRAVIEYKTDQYRLARRRGEGMTAAQAGRHRRAGSHGAGTGTVPLTMLVDDAEAEQAWATETAPQPEAPAPVQPEEE